MGMRVDIVTLFRRCASRYWMPASSAAPPSGAILRPTATRSAITRPISRSRPTTIPTAAAAAWCCTPSPSRTASAPCRRKWRNRRPKPHIVFLTAGGQRYTEEHARRLAEYDNLTLVCGHYEGIDERVIDAFADEEISIGDYILTGGELASLVVADSVLRLKPGVLAEQKDTKRKATGMAAGVSAVHPAGSLGGPRGAAGAAGRRPPEDRRLAGRAEPHPYPAAPPGAV